MNDKFLIYIRILYRQERNIHGFIYEEKIIKKYNMIKSSNYLSKFDAYYNKIPVQIKCIKRNGAVELGSYIRNKNIKENFILIIGFWENNKTNITSESFLFIDYLKYKQNFEFEYDEEMFQEMKLITNLKIDNKRWKIFCNKYKLHWSEENMINIRFKRDNKTQKRIQCAIPNKNLKKFIDTFKEIEL